MLKLWGWESANASCDSGKHVSIDFRDPVCDGSTILCSHSAGPKRSPPFRLTFLSPLFFLPRIISPINARIFLYRTSVKRVCALNRRGPWHRHITKGISNFEPYKLRQSLYRPIKRWEPMSIKGSYMNALACMFSGTISAACSTHSAYRE